MLIAISVLLLVVYVVFTYNRFVKRRNLVDEAWSGVDVQLKRRSDLIPRLLDVVKGYAAHEVETLQKIVQARNEMQKDDQLSISKHAVQESALSRGLGKIFALAESYPDLKASTNFGELHKALSDTEDQIQFARRYYNGAVRDYQLLLESFPSNIIGRFTGFTKRDFFELESASERIVPKV